MKVYVLERYHKIIQEAKEKKGNKCVECSTCENLHFDHIDTSDKNFTIAKLWSLNEEARETELKKCQLLCVDCHKKKHSSKYPCGTKQRYYRGCRCQPCKTAYNESFTEWKKQSKLKNKQNSQSL